MSSAYGCRWSASSIGVVSPLYGPTNKTTVNNLFHFVQFCRFCSILSVSVNFSNVYNNVKNSRQMNEVLPNLANKCFHLTIFFSISELFTCNIQRLRQDSQRCFISACNTLHSSLLWPLLLRGQDHLQGSGWVHGYRTIHATSQYQQIARMGQVVLWVSRRWWQRILWQWYRTSKFQQAWATILES